MLNPSALTSGIIFYGKFKSRPWGQSALVLKALAIGGIYLHGCCDTAAKLQYAREVKPSRLKELHVD